MDTKITWEKYGKSTVALDVEHGQVFAVISEVGASEGAPCKMFTIQYMNNTFVNDADARLEVECDFQEWLKHKDQPPPTTQNVLIGLLKNILAGLEGMEKVKP